MRSRVRLGCLGAALLVFASLSSSCGGEPLDACAAREAVGYPDMEAAAQTVLAGIDFSLRRAGSCEETGRPWSRLEATVKDWSNRNTANRYFAEKGWTRDDAGLLSPNGAYRLNIATARDADSTESFVSLEFSEVADEADWAGQAAG